MIRTTILIFVTLGILTALIARDGDTILKPNRIGAEIIVNG